MFLEGIWLVLSIGFKGYCPSLTKANHYENDIILDHEILNKDEKDCVKFKTPIEALNRQLDMAKYWISGLI